MKRVLVVGTSGSGKTTTARRLAAVLDARHVELDALFWNPGWEEADVPTFRARVCDALDTPSWVACGNYWSKLRDMTWASADTVVWLDLPVRTCRRRVVVRTLQRSLLRRDLWSGNRERLGDLWAADSLVRPLRARKRAFTARYAGAAADTSFAHIEVVRLTSPAQVRRWMRQVSGAGAP